MNVDLQLLLQLVQVLALLGPAPHVGGSLGSLLQKSLTGFSPERRGLKPEAAAVCRLLQVLSLEVW